VYSFYSFRDLTDIKWTLVFRHIFFEEYTNMRERRRAATLKAMREGPWRGHPGNCAMGPSPAYLATLFPWFQFPHLRLDLKLHFFLLKVGLCINRCICYSFCVWYVPIKFVCMEPCGRCVCYLE
jgi:hypothetical protein